MRLVSWLFRIVLFAAAFLFAAVNIKTNTLLNVGLPEPVTAPLVLFLLAFFVGGVATGLLAVVPTIFRQRRQIGRLKKEIKLGAKAQANSIAPIPDASPAVDVSSPTASRLGV